MQAIDSFILLFSDVWKQGIFGINASEIIIGLWMKEFFITAHITNMKIN